MDKDVIVIVETECCDASSEGSSRYQQRRALTVQKMQTLLRACFSEGRGKRESGARSSCLLCFSKAAVWFLIASI